MHYGTDYNYYNIKFALSANNTLQVPASISCACPGEVLTFLCNIIGGGTTLWSGTAFSCLSNEILLRHSQFSEPRGTSGSCNDGTITGRSIGVTDGCYTSELNVTVSTSLSNKTVQCIHDASTGPRTINVSTLIVATGKNIRA